LQEESQKDIKQILFRENMSLTGQKDQGEDFLFTGILLKSKSKE